MRVLFLVSGYGSIIAIKSQMVRKQVDETNEVQSSRHGFPAGASRRGNQLPQPKFIPPSWGVFLFA